uniref:LRRNT domain-containing protein n=1 Tax=Steinernema glaseri TaxID=37863 RepID=A0A1I7YVN9_9BILA
MRILPYLFICLLALHGAVSSDSESQEDDDDYEEQDRPDQLVCGTSWNCTCTKEEDPTVICDHARLKDSDTRLGTTYIGFPKDYKPKIVHMKDCDIKKLEKDRIVPSVAKQLVELDLSSNSIDYIGKDAFKGMDHLAILRLSHNNIKKLHRNTFHDDLGFKLHRLFLDYNDIENLPENAFEGLKELKMLVLDGNVFTQKLNKKMFAGLSNLETLSLDYCGLDHDSLPFDAFDELINLKALSLRGNKFEKVPAAVNSINHLEILDMSKTKVAEFGERSLKSDHKIKKLIMTDLPYMYFISNCAFCDLKNLERAIAFRSERICFAVERHKRGTNVFLCPWLICPTGQNIHFL